MLSNRGEGMGGGGNVNENNGVALLNRSICRRVLQLDVRARISGSAAPSDLTARNLFNLLNQNKCRWTGFTAPHLGLNQPRWNRNRFAEKSK